MSWPAMSSGARRRVLSRSLAGGARCMSMRSARRRLWARTPVFESGAGGLVSTVDDYLAFGRMMLAKGLHGRERILSRPSVELMTADHITAEQKAASDFFPGFWDHRGWGFGMAIVTRRDDLARSVEPTAGTAATA